MAIHNITKNHFSVVVKKVRAAVLRANYLANGHAQRLILKLMDSEGRQDRCDLSVNPKGTIQK